MVLVWLTMLAAGCNNPGCGQKTAQLMLPADCSEEAFIQHGTFYDKKAYTWTRRCPDGSRQEGTLRIGAAMFADDLGCQEAEGDCTPCLPALHGTCARTGRGLFTGHIVGSGDKPHGAGLFLRCEAPEPQVALFFQDQDGAAISTCTADAYGKTRCDDECSVTFQQVPEADK